MGLYDHITISDEFLDHYTVNTDKTNVYQTKSFPEPFLQHYNISNSMLYYCPRQKSNPQFLDKAKGILHFYDPPHHGIYHIVNGRVVHKHYAQYEQWPYLVDHVDTGLSPDLKQVRVKLIEFTPSNMTDDHQNVPKGTIGHVTSFNADGSIGVRWDNGSTLKLLPEDRYIYLPHSHSLSNEQ